MSVARLLLDCDPTAPPAAAIALDEALREMVGAAQAPAALRVWECAEAIVLPRRQLRSLAERPPGLTLCERASGGSAVGLGPGVVCVSLALPLSAGQPTIEEAYRLWVAGVGAGLRSAYGVEAQAGDVPGAFCDGAFNAVVGGRKIAGTAQARRRGVVLVHGCLLVDVDRQRYCAALAQLDGAADPSLVTTLHEETGREIARAELADAIAAGFAAEGLGPFVSAASPTPTRP